MAFLSVEKMGVHNLPVNFSPAILQPCSLVGEFGADGDSGDNSVDDDDDDNENTKANRRNECTKT